MAVVADGVVYCEWSVDVGLVGAAVAEWGHLVTSLALLPRLSQALLRYHVGHSHGGHISTSMVTISDLTTITIITD